MGGHARVWEMWNVNVMKVEGVNFTLGNLEYKCGNLRLPLIMTHVALVKYRVVDRVEA
jgi:hypothetical protein